MQVSANDIAVLMQDFADLLEEEPGAWIPCLDDEPPPEEIELIAYSAPAASPAAAATTTASPAAQRPAAPPPRELPANFRCTLCPDRMYPVRRYNRSGRKPVLVLYHGGSFGKGPARLDRSRDFIFGSAEEDDLFERMLGAVDSGETKLVLEDLHYQEYPACHFNAVRSTPDDWRDRGAHCLTHVHDTVEREGIRLLILTGPAAVILLGPERARELSESCERIGVNTGSREIPALVMRSPAALLALEAKRKRLQRADADDARYRETAEQEKSIKRQMLTALQAALAGVS